MFPIPDLSDPAISSLDPFGLHLSAAEVLHQVRDRVLREAQQCRAYDQEPFMHLEVLRIFA